MTIHNNNRKWIWMGAGVLIIVIAVAVVVVSVNKVSETTNWQEQNRSAKTEKEIENTNESTDQNVDVPKKEDVKQYEGDSPNKSETLTGAISYIGVNGGDLNIRLNIDQYLTTGSCTLNLTQGESIIYSKIAAIEGSVSTSTCDGFKIPVSELPTGAMMVEIILESGNKYGKIVRELQI